eukprot:CAMPEP_0171978844 /NCGR_PEP_ID=MMETSP0993-20121228/254104_1 /TAXON_ID=483369 /ORGANISM="non described non described, Strain CCMP2098" /LENGTH=299 /DNA_ID=CAMNT_0012630843 /DNA_START=178 /DNA_END=1074 /DNA_ORIENTATION=-
MVWASGRNLYELSDANPVGSFKECTDNAASIANCRGLLVAVAAVLAVALFCVTSCRFLRGRRRTPPAVDELGSPLLNGADDEYDDEGIPVASNIVERLLNAMKLNRPGWRTLGMIEFDQLRLVDQATGELSQQPFAAGAGGVVYRGSFLDRPVAIKALYSQMHERGELEEISREAALLVRVAHPNITRLYGVSHHLGVLYLVTDFVPCSLASVVERSEEAEEEEGGGSQGGDYSPADMLRLADQILSAVGFMHSRGVAHRDLKPENILLTAEGDVRICDLGIASFTDIIQETSTTTTTT